MKILSARVHGVLDYFLVVFFLFAPRLIGFEGTAASLFAIIAVSLLTLTLLTDFAPGAVRVIPFAVHGVLELFAAFVLLLSPWLLDFAEVGVARWICIATGVGLFALWAVTNYAASLIELAPDDEHSLPPSANAHRSYS